MMGSGKTTIGQMLASRLNIPFYDTDYLIEKKVGMTIADMFRTHSEAFFRTQECQLMEQWSIDEGVIATGGGLPCHSSLMEVLIKKGHVIYLECPPADLAERLKERASRPLLMDLNESEVTQFLESQLKNRESFYLGATWRVDAGQSTNQIVNQLLHWLNIS